MMPTRIMIVDDQLLYLELLGKMFETEEGIELVGLAVSETEMWPILKSREVDLVLLDVELPSDAGRDGIQLAAELRREYPGLKIVSMSMNTRSEILRKLLKEIAVDGFVDKNESSMSGLLDAVKLVMQGMVYTSPEIRRKVQHIRKVETLSSREYEVLTFIANGSSIESIAAKLSLAYKTIDNHKQNIYKKLNCHSSAEATAIFMKHVFLHQDDLGQLPQFKREIIETD